MGWASEQFWRDMGMAGIYPNIPSKAQKQEEWRCRICGERERCPAFETGVASPCKHFRRDKHD